MGRGVNSIFLAQLHSSAHFYAHFSMCYPNPNFSVKTIRKFHFTGSFRFPMSILERSAEKWRFHSR